LVPRERLFGQLDQILARQVGLVSAPAGFGKTTLVAAWVARCPHPVAWLSLDDADNDPTRFLAYAIGALQRVQPEVGQSTLAMLRAPQPPPLPALLLPLINDVDALESSQVLVLDDYHLIQAQGVHDALTFLIDHQPDKLHLVLATRADPPLPIARLRGRGQLVELRQADLRFTLPEAEAFLRLAGVSRLTLASIEVLAERTEGWAAGLQMAATSLQNTADVDAFVSTFAGTQRHILDYLGEEIFQRQPPQVQRFLERTSILDRFCAPLCEAVLQDEPCLPEPAYVPTASTDSSARPAAVTILEHLERANLFITPLDEQRQWYRYHHLFADLLRQRLRQAEPELAPVLHGRASRWLEAQGLAHESIQHALAAGEAERAADMIGRAAPGEWKRGGLTTLWRWLEALPEAATRAAPVLCVLRGLAAVMTGASLGQGSKWLAAAEQADRATGQHTGEIAVLGSLLALLRGEMEAGTRLAERALAHLPESSPFHGLARRGLSGLYLLRGDYDQAIAVLERDVRASQQSGDQLGAAASVRRLGSVRLLTGQLGAAHELYQRSLAMSVDGAGHRWPVAGRALVHLAELQYEWNDLETAERLVREGIALAEQIAPNWNTTAYVTLAEIRQARGDPAGALRALEQARQLAAQSDSELDDVLVAAHAVRLTLRQGDLALALRLAAGRPIARLAGHSARDVEALLTSVWAREADGLIAARLDLAQGQAARACEVLAPLLRAAEARAHGSRIEILVVQALAHQAEGDTAAALKALARALALAEPEDYVRVFLDEGEPMVRLLQQVAGPRRSYSQRLLAKAARAAAGGPTGTRAPAGDDGTDQLDETLSERECEILSLIAEGLSNHEIGARLYLASGTIKSYTYSLYGKLGVHSRTQAVARGRALGLLPRL
jgi:LuxR family maltose regulon positive regulatory protein